MIFEELAWRDPIDAFAPLAGTSHAHLLHAGANSEQPGWSVIVTDPSNVYCARNGRAIVDGADTDGDPFDVLQHLLKSRSPFEPAPQAPDAPFLTGALGFIGYEAGALFEPSATGPVSPFPFPDMAFGFYDGALVFDRNNRRVYVSALTADIAENLKRIFHLHSQSDPSQNNADGASSNFTREKFRSAVSIVIDAILKGDIFQANIAQHLSAREYSATPFDIFGKLSSASDAPFGAFLQYEEGGILSNSPERFFHLSDERGVRRVRTEPIKGTRPRGRTEMEDRELADGLINDEKERAENIMIADLMRNDLSRICKDESIFEEEICKLVSLASVHHLVSIISGELKEGLGVVDVIRALFPCGSITGAPKIQAMKTIAAIEPCGRGPYCGAIGYVDDRGNADFSVSIRTMIATPGKIGHDLVFPVGGGVTLRSEPEAEYQETLVKARSILWALEISDIVP